MQARISWSCSGYSAESLLNIPLPFYAKSWVSDKVRCNWCCLSSRLQSKLRHANRYRAAFRRPLFLFGDTFLHLFAYLTFFYLFLFRCLRIFFFNVFSKWSQREEFLLVHLTETPISYEGSCFRFPSVEWKPRLVALMSGKTRNWGLTSETPLRNWMLASPCIPKWMVSGATSRSPDSVNNASPNNLREGITEAGSSSTLVPWLIIFRINEQKQF